MYENWGSQTRAVCVHDALASGQLTAREYAEAVGTLKSWELQVLSTMLTRDFYDCLMVHLTDPKYARVLRS